MKQPQFAFYTEFDGHVRKHVWSTSEGGGIEYVDTETLEFMQDHDMDDALLISMATSRHKTMRRFITRQVHIHTTYRTDLDKYSIY